MKVTLAQSFAQVIKISIFLLLKLSFYLLVDCVVEKRKSQDLSACSISCGQNLEEVTIIIPGEHGGRDDCVEQPPVVLGEFPCNLPACTTDIPLTPKPVPGSFSQQTRNYFCSLSEEDINANSNFLMLHNIDLGGRVRGGHYVAIFIFRWKWANDIIILRCFHLSIQMTNC